MDDRIATNMRNWDERVADHVVAYDAEAFADDPHAVGVGVEAEVLRPHLPGGSLDGLDVVHLQCHIGTDTISLARRGARVVGTDLSGEAVTTARRLAARAGLPDVSFVQTTNEDAPDALGREFDVVLTSVGVLTWLADLRPWAQAVARLLRPGGVFLVHDAHPTMSALQHDRDDDLLVLGEPYFSDGGPRRFDDGTTYASGTRMQNAVTYQWTHDLGEVVGAVLQAGLRIVAFQEHRSIPWKALPSLVPGDRGWELPEGSAECPLMFSLVARRA
ncbi:class I SAM-dependent methyltransferase [Kineococcus sp. DHX-1]|uniref:class I SAM-dependent methyltransferase n=1 Tax=Kineococcus sp. DHX-1 TaxID=3349638 RepID=UPI0036D28EDA